MNYFCINQKNHKMEFTFSGFIKHEYNDYSKIFLVDGDKSIDLVKKFRAIFELFECEVMVSYFTSEQKKSESEIKEAWLQKMVGVIDADYESNSYYYSEYTYGTDYDSYLRIGGHDLFWELYELQEKFCIIKINLKTN